MELGTLECSVMLRATVLGLMQMFGGEWVSHEVSTFLECAMDREGFWAVVHTTGEIEIIDDGQECVGHYLGREWLQGDDLAAFLTWLGDVTFTAEG